jgi:magnesium chelatase family protein
VRVAGARSLGQVGEWLRGDGALDTPTGPPGPVAPDPVAAEDLAEVRGQPLARRALEVAAAGIGNEGYQNLRNG